MQLKDIMSKNIDHVSPDTSLRDAAQCMQERDVGVLPVCENERLCGLLTDRDIVVRSAARGQDPNQAKVRDVMSSDVVSCFEDDDVETVSQRMQDRQIRRIPVVDRQQHVVGMVSLGDLANKANDPSRAGQTLQSVSQPGH